jgi:hypothetical protein
MVLVVNPPEQAAFLEQDRSLSCERRPRAGLQLSTPWETDEATLRGFFAVPACRVSWARNRHLMSGEYRDLVDGLAREVKPQTPTDIVATWRRLTSQELEAAAGTLSVA